LWNAIIELALFLQRRHKDFPGFDREAIADAAANNMNAVDLLFDIEGDDAELLHWFGLEVRDGFEDIIADCRLATLIL
jgi:hypothetical protein